MRINTLGVFFSMIVKGGSWRYTTALVVLAICQTLVAIAIPFVGSNKPVNVSDKMLISSLGLGCYIFYTSFSKFLVRIFGERINASIREAILERLFIAGKLGSSDLTLESWRTAILVDMQRLRELMEDSLPRFISSCLVASVALIIIGHVILPAILLFILIGLLVLGMAWGLRRYIEKASTIARDAEEEFNRRFMIASQSIEMFLGNSGSPGSFRMLTNYNELIRKRYNVLNRWEALLDPFISIIVLILVYVTYYVFDQRLRSGLGDSESLFLLMWALIGVPAFLDVINSTISILRQSASLSRVYAAISDRNQASLFRFVRDTKLKVVSEKETATLEIVKGPSGSGKTSRVRDLVRNLESSAYVPQNRPNLDLPLLEIADLYYGLNDSFDWKAKFEILVQEFGLGELDLFGLKSLESLSGGEKARLLVALAFSTRARVVVLDEPEAGLDSKNLERLCSVVQNESESRVVIWSGHFNKVSQIEEV